MPDVIEWMVMTTIKRAFRKHSAGEPDFVSELAALDNMSLFPQPREQQHAEFVQVANMLLEFKGRDRGSVIGFASSVAGEGSSFVSYNVGLQLAHVLNRRVLWVDANFVTPQRKLLAQKQTTLMDLIRDPGKFDSLPAGSRFEQLAGGLDLAKSTSLLASDAYQTFIAKCEDNYDFTLIDCPPILTNVETGFLAAPTSGLVVVVERSRLKWEVIRSGLDMLSNKRVNILGTVFNRRQYELPKFIYDKL